MLAAAGFGLVIGLLLGLLGGGGSILAVPALVYGVGQPLRQAIPTSLLVVGVSAVAGALPRIHARQVQWRLASIFAGTGAIAAIGGAYVNREIPPRVVLIGFAALMITAGLRMQRHSDSTGTACSTTGGGINWRRCLPRAIGSGIGVGFLTGLFGVGGGFVIIPALVVLLGLDMTTAVGTSLVIVAANSASGFAAHIGDAPLDAGIAVTFTSTAVLASLVAARVGARQNTDHLQRWFAYLVFAVALFVIAAAVLNPAAA